MSKNNALKADTRYVKFNYTKKSSGNVALGAINIVNTAVTVDITDAKFINDIGVKKLLSFDESSIDLMLPVLLEEYGFDCYVVNGKIPQRVLSIIDEETCDFPYTYINNH